MLIDYGHGSFDLNHRCRVTSLKKMLNEGKGDITFANGLVSMVGCGNCKKPPQSRYPRWTNTAQL